jgi:hypothetical protein
MTLFPSRLGVPVGHVENTRPSDSRFFLCRACQLKAPQILPLYCPLKDRFFAFSFGRSLDLSLFKVMQMASSAFKGSFSAHFLVYDEREPFKYVHRLGAAT